MLLSQNLAKDKDKKYKKSRAARAENDDNLVTDPLRNSRIPPQDLDAEKALLASLLLSPESMFEVVDLVSRSIFYAERHAMIFEVIENLIQKKEPVDLLTVSARLRDLKELEIVGGAAYLSELIGSVSSATNIKYYAQIVRKKALLRRLISAANHIGEIAYNEEEDLELVMEEAEKKIFDLTTRGSGTARLIHMGEMMEETWARIERLSESKEGVRGVPSGFKDLDNKLSGFQKSDLIILAARPSVGKTSLALDIARHAAVKHSIPVAVFSLEMSRQQLVDRMLAAQANVDSWKLRTAPHLLSIDDELSRLQEGMNELMQAPIYIDDKPANTIMNMRSMLRRLSIDQPIGLVVVDYLQLMGTAKSYDNMVNQVTEISRSLKGLAKEFDVPVLALSQLSRAVESRGGRPRLSDLRDSGSIEQDADVVMIIHREDKYGESNEKRNVVEILIEKHRNGPTGIVELAFDDKKATFLTVEKSEFGDFVMPSVRLPEL